jgi:hypothetical protein
VLRFIWERICRIESILNSEKIFLEKQKTEALKTHDLPIFLIEKLVGYDIIKVVGSMYLLSDLLLLQHNLLEVTLFYQIKYLS